MTNTCTSCFFEFSFAKKILVRFEWRESNQFSPVFDVRISLDKTIYTVNKEALISLCGCAYDFRQLMY